MRKQYSIIHRLINKFNGTIEIVKHSDQEIKLEIEQLLYIVIGETQNLNKLTIHDTHPQFSMIFSILLKY